MREVMANQKPKNEIERIIEVPTIIEKIVQVRNEVPV